MEHDGCRVEIQFCFTFEIKSATVSRIRFLLQGFLNHIS